VADSYSACPSCGKVNGVNAAAVHAGKTAVCGSCGAVLSVYEVSGGLISDLDASGLSALIGSSPLPVVVDFWAPWCGPCRAFAPAFEQAARTLVGKAVFVKINTEEHPAAGEAYRVRGIPTLIHFRDGTESKRISGAMQVNQFLDWLNG